MWLLVAFSFVLAGIVGWLVLHRGTSIAKIAPIPTQETSTSGRTETVSRSSDGCPGSDSPQGQKHFSVSSPLNAEVAQVAQLKPAYDVAEFMMREEDWNELMSFSNTLTFSKKEIILEDNAFNTDLYRVVSGKVRVVKGPNRIATLRESEVFGEMSFLGQHITSAEVHAIREGTEIAQIKRSLANAVFSKDDRIFLRFYYCIARAIAQRLRVRVRRKTAELHKKWDDRSSEMSDVPDELSESSGTSTSNEEGDSSSGLLRVYLDMDDVYTTILYQSNCDFHQIRAKVAEAVTINMAGRKFFVVSEVGDPYMVPLDTTVQKTVAALVQDPTSAVYFIPSEPPSVLLQKFGLAVPQDAVIHKYSCKMKGHAKGTLYVSPQYLAYSSRRLALEYKTVIDIGKIGQFFVNDCALSVISGGKVKKFTFESPKVVQEAESFLKSSMERKAAGASSVAKAEQYVQKRSLQAQSNLSASNDFSIDESGTSIRFQEEEESDFDFDEKEVQDPSRIRFRSQVKVFNGKILFKCIAREMYAGNNESFLSFAKNEIISVDSTETSLQNQAEEYWHGCIESCNEKRAGYFPASAVRKLAAEDERTLFQAGYEDVSQLPTAAEWEQILKCGEERNYRKGETIVKRGEVLGSLFQVQSGHCVVTKKGSRVGVVTANQMFGEMSLVLNDKATASVVADSDDVLIFILPAAEIMDICSKQPRLGGRFFRYISILLERRLRLHNNTIFCERTDSVISERD